MPSVDITTTTINKQGIALSGRFCWRNQRSWQHAQYMTNNHEKQPKEKHSITNLWQQQRWPGWINKAGNNTKPWIMTRNRTSDPHIHKTNNKTQQQQRWPGWLQGRALNKNIKSKSWLASFIGTSDLPKQQDNIKCESWMASFIGTSDTHQPTTTSRVNLDWLRLSEPQIY